MLKVQFVYDKTETITLPLTEDHDVPGKYYAFITPTVSGYYQANLIGKILETPVNLSLHPPPIAERSYIEFPQSADLALTEVIDDNSKLEQKIETLENTIKNLETSNNQLKDQIDGYFVMVLPIGIIGIIIAIIALIKTRRS